MEAFACDDPKPAPLFDFVMEASICAAIAAFVLTLSLPVTVAVLCVAWLLGMVLADPLRG
ncbi:hypothetical protein KUV62_20555 [Salipiger bermudensis]|uniref:hypothetical protein n=1 Tax=Salipiger bermudensis TaxID=344736 RepID=UPI001C99392C|nr:hypothetical protein [Salipiger bermudensis]MBY6006326.1 hypothetical protein [Salipiger bermudensis]